MKRKPRAPLNRRQTLHKLLGGVSSRKAIQGWACARCGHRWAARMHAYRLKRGARPVACPACKRRNWWIEDGILQKSRKLPFRPCCEDRAAYGTPHKATCTREGAI